MDLKLTDGTNAVVIGALQKPSGTVRTTCCSFATTPAGVGSFPRAF